MNILCRIAACGAALCLTASMLVGCRDSKAIAEDLAVIKESCEKSIANESGEILIYKTVKLEKDIEGVLCNTSEETYVKYADNTADPNFSLTRTATVGATGETSTYEFIKDGDTKLELVDGYGEFVDIDTPDIFEMFRVDYAESDIKDIGTQAKEKGIDQYAVLMTGEFADKFDTELDGVTVDCTQVLYCYYIDSVLNLTNLLCEYTYVVTANGETQTMVEFFDAKIE